MTESKLESASGGKADEAKETQQRHRSRRDSDETNGGLDTVIAQ